MKSSRLSLVETLIVGGFVSLTTLVLAAGCGGTSSLPGEDVLGGGGTATGAGGGSTGGSTASGGAGTGGVVGAGGTLGSGGGASTGGGGTGGTAAVVCPETVLPAGDTTRMLSVGGKTRSYVLHVPTNPNPGAAVPLLLDFHPLGGSGSGQRASSPYPAQTDADGVLVAFPSGESGPSGGAWNVGPCCVAGTDDVEFARAIVEDIQSVSCIDPKRIYASGFSMGGGMTHYLGCHAADLFAAIAPAAFDLLEENIDDCEPSRPLTVVAFRGTNDFVVPYDGGDSAVVSGMPITFLGAETTFEEWADFNGCTGSPVDAGNGCERYESCQAGVTVTLCTKSGGGHEQGTASIAWPILKQHTLP